jgi:ABC-2 type transport system permease protein
VTTATAPATLEARVPFSTVVLGLAGRSLNRIRRIPAAIIPTVAMPIFLLVAFSGSFSAITDIPGFPTDNILNWVAPYAILQGAAFAGASASQAVAADLESGFYDRLLMAPASRWSLLMAPVTATVVRVLLPFVSVTAIAVLGGARFEGGILGVVTLFVAAEGFAFVAALWGLGVVYRLRTQRSGAIVQVGIFVVAFLSIGQVPLAVMQGWLHGVARINPLTNVLRMARQGLIGDVTWAATWPGLVVIAGGILVFGAFAATGLRRIND